MSNFITWNTSTQMQHEISKRAVEVYISLSERQNLNLGIRSSIILFYLSPLISVKYFHLKALKNLVLFEKMLRRQV